MLLLPALLLAACSGGNGESSTPTATAPAAPTLPPFPTRAPQPSATPVNTYPPDTRTGIDVIDKAIEAVLSGDPQAVIAQLSFHPYRCDNAPSGSQGTNPCPPGVPEGSAVDVIAAGGCDVSFLARDRASLVTQVTQFEQDVASQGIYAVVEVQQGRLASPLPLRYLIILSGGYSLLLDDTGITHLGLPCDGVGPAQLFHPADRPILPPR